MFKPIFVDFRGEYKEKQEDEDRGTEESKQADGR